MSVVGIVSDLHAPFVHPQYLRFVKDTFRKYKVNQVVFIGDVADFHSLSFFDHNPSEMSPGGELEAARQVIAPWVKAFPKALVCIGNHDERIQRRAMKFGLPVELIKSYADIFETPGWTWDMEFTIDGVLYIHGTGASGKDAAINLALQRRMSAVMGHVHSFAGAKFHANTDSLIFGLNVGCGIDIRSYAFEYGRAFPIRPVLGCGIVIDGKVGMFIPMPCGKGEKYYKHGPLGPASETKE